MTDQAGTPSALFHTLLDRFSVLDFEGINALLHDDSVFDFPFRDENPTLEGRAAIMERLNTSMAVNFAHLDFTVKAVHLCQDPNLVIAEYESVGKLRSGRTYRNRYVGMVRARDGRIELFREYLNPLAFARATA